MVSTDDGESSSKCVESTAVESKNHIPLHISTSQRGLISDESSRSEYGDGFSALPKRLNFLNFGNLDSPSAKFQRISTERDEISRNVPSASSLHIRERFQKLFSRKMDWDSLLRMSKDWIRNPLNLALFIWIVCVAISGAILFMVMSGMLNHALPSKSQRNAWFEVNNQILNALFTLMCLYQHPQRIYHLALLSRWRQEDILKLRKAYCKNGTYKPIEWAHMMVVVLLLNINCLAQYALCGLNLGYKRSQRPPIGVGLCISVAIGAPAIAGIYTMLSPLGKEYESGMDEESQITVGAEDSVRQDQSRRQSLEKRFSFASGRTLEATPRWSGGILDLWDDISLAYLSLFCTFCVFGWNMERLGFGNMYVHIATFLLFCSAPFWIFNLAAVNIDNESVREALGLAGIFLCIFGLLYGGFWRIQMRKRYNLPSYTFCCGKPSVSDCALWLCCCWCSLAQEVRTGNSYDIVEDKFYEKQGSPLSPLPREDGGQFQSPSPTRFAKGHYSPDGKLSSIEETMKAPSPSVISREESNPPSQ